MFFLFPSPFRMSRARASHLLFLALAAMAGAASADTWFNPFASFESRCEALPPPRFEVEALPVLHVEDDSVSLHDLTRIHAPGADRHRTIGLTTGQLAYESTLESKGIEDARGGRACMRPSVKIVLRVTPMTVYVAREFATDSCRRPAIMAHEMKHVAVYREYLAEVVADIGRELPGALGTDVVYAKSAAAAQAVLRARLQAFMPPFMQKRYAELAARQAAIDTPEEYARLAHTCPAPPAPG
jgi:hypothetical protein